MTRQIVIIALVLFAIVGFSAAAATSPTAAPSNDIIGNTDSGSNSSLGDDAEAGSIGGPVPAGVFPESPEEAPVGSPHSGVSTIGVSTIAGVAAAAMAVVFF